VHRSHCPPSTCRASKAAGRRDGGASSTPETASPPAIAAAAAPWPEPLFPARALAAAAVAGDLPIRPQIPPALAALDASACLILEAPPGAGKTTALPLAILEYDSPVYLGDGDGGDGDGGDGDGGDGDGSGDGGRGSSAVSSSRRRKTILVVEPRRVAAKAAARRMAAALGQGPTGSRACRVGFSVRLERSVGPGARVICITEGVLLRRLLRDPSLAGVGCVIFDEYHERSADADAALALCLDSQQGGLRPDLRLVVMSATLGGGLAGGLSRMMGRATVGAKAEAGAAAARDGSNGGDVESATAPAAAAAASCAPVLASDGRSYPVKTVYLGTPAMLADGREAAASSSYAGARGGGLFGGLPAIARARPGVVEAAIAGAVALALEENAAGDVLAFLPGVAHIRRAQRLLAERHGVGRGGKHAAVRVDVLHGSLPPAQQDAVLRPPPSLSASSSFAAAASRRVVLATPIAESSVTLDGVVAVVDCGLRRSPRFDPRTGVSRLATVPVSEAAADQRRGRAGRTGPGVAYRLWDSGEDLEPATAPEIADADLAPLALTLAAWGAPFDETGGLRWLDPPDRERLGRAFGLLRGLGAVEEEEGDEDDGEAGRDMAAALAAAAAAGVVGPLAAPPPPPPPRITARGRAMAALGAHPRYAQLALRGARAEGGGGGAAASKDRGRLDCPELACVVASLLGERDVLVQAPSAGGGSGRDGRPGVGGSSAARSADLRTRLQALADAGAGLGGGRAARPLYQGVPAPRADEVDRLAAGRVIDGARQMHGRVRRLQLLLEAGEDGEEDEEGEGASDREDATAAALSVEEEDEAETADTDDDDDEDDDEDQGGRRPRSAGAAAPSPKATMGFVDDAAEARRFHDAWTGQARARPALVGALVASAYPDRVARVRPQTLGSQRPEVSLASGGTATLPRPAREDSVMDGDPELLAVAELSGGGVAGRTGAARADVVRLAAPLPMAAAEALLAADIVERETVAWAPAARRVVGRRQTRLGALVLRESALPPEALTDARCAPVIVAALQREALLLMGGGGGGGGGSGAGDAGDAGGNGGSGGNEAGLAQALNLPAPFEAWRARVEWLRAAEVGAAGETDLPDMSAAALVREMPRWLAPLLAGCRSRADVLKGGGGGGAAAVDIPTALRARLSPEQQRRVERDAPARAPLPLGGTVAVDYAHAAGPTARARVQEVFGLAQTPLLGGPRARVPLRLELLDPAQRPLAATSDLASFWATGYPLARKDLRGRYPRHVWPEDGAAAEPTRMTKAKTEAAAKAKAAAEEGAKAGAGAGAGGKQRQAKGGGGAAAAAGGKNKRR